MRALAHSDSFLLLALSESAPGGPDHDWKFSHRYFVNHFFPNEGLGIVFRIYFDSAVGEINFDFAFIVEVSESAHHGIDLEDRFI
jgi:hypothetical protein